MIPVYLLGHSNRPILGSTLSELVEIAVRGAGLLLVDRLPGEGDVILVDPDAAITAETLSTLANARHDPDGLPLVDRHHLVARVNAAVLVGRRIPTVDSLLGRNVDVIDVPAASYRGRFERRRAEAVLQGHSLPESRQVPGSRASKSWG